MGANYASATRFANRLMNFLGRAGTVDRCCSRQAGGAPDVAVEARRAKMQTAMPEPTRAPRFLRGAAPDTEARLIALVSVSFAFSLLLQTSRMVDRLGEIFSTPEKLGLSGVAGFLGSSLIFQAALASFCTGSLLLVRRRRLRAAWTLLLQALVIAVMAVEASCHLYFLKTGATLDWPLFAYAVSRPHDVALISGDVVDPRLVGFLGVSALLVAAAPWLAGLRARKRRADPGAIEGGRRLALAMALGAFPLAAAGLLTGTPLAVDAATVRDPVLNLIASGLGSIRQGAAAGSPRPRAFELEITPVRPREKQPLNLVIVLLESARATATSLFPPFYDTTPFLKELATKSLVASRFYAPMPQTKKALQHILCGRPASHSIRPQSYVLGLNGRCLPNVLREQGYQTVFIQSADESFDQRPGVAFSMGFERFIGPRSYSHQGFERANFLGFDDESMLAPSREWLQQRRKDRPFFATYLTVAMHFACKPLTRHGLRHYVDDPEFDCYLNNLRHDDFFVRALIEEYRALGLLDHTLFVITADHGEAFGEHRRRGHGDTPGNEALRTPFLLYDPTGIRVPPGIVATPASQLDIAPTVLDLLGFRVTGGELEGSSLLHLPPDRTLHMSCSCEDNCLASVQGDSKFIYYQWRHAPELFDLATDPLELHDLSGAFPGVVQARQAEVLEWDRRIRSFYDYFETHRPPKASTARMESRAPGNAGTLEGG